MRPFEKYITQVPSSIITEVIDQRVTQCSSQVRFYWWNVHFSEGRNSINTWPILLKFGTVVSLPDVNWHLKFEQNWRWSGFWVIDLTWNRPRERVKESKKKRTGGQKCCLSGFLAFASYWAILWKKLHFLPEVNICSPICPTIWTICMRAFLWYPLCLRGRWTD